MLDDAFNAFLEGQGRWAYTETHSGSDLDGKPKGETIFRVDPSLPYKEQFIPVKLGGKTPSEKQLKQWALRGESGAKRRQEHEVDEKSAVYRHEDIHLWINNQKVTPELERAVVVAEDENSVTYEVPMRKEGGADGALFDKFQLTARVSKQQHQFERVTIRQRSPMRVKLIAKLSEGLIEIEFGSPDTRFPALPIKTSSRMTINLFFGKAHTVRDLGVNTDLKHVTPYDERFGVKLGPMRTIEL